MTHAEQLQVKAEAAFEGSDWSDEQDRSDWFENEAQAYAGLADQLQARLDAMQAALQAQVDYAERGIKSSQRSDNPAGKLVTFALFLSGVKRALEGR